MDSVCGNDCCNSCPKLSDCGGCEKTNAHPFGGNCIAAECIKKTGQDGFLHLKETLIKEFNCLNIKDLKVSELNLLNGFFVNMEYTLPNGQKVKLLNDSYIYLGSQIEIPHSDLCYGFVADENYLLVCKYGQNGVNPQLIIYKKRGCDNGIY